MKGDPCTSAEGRQKVRWPTRAAAQYAADLWAMGRNPHMGHWRGDPQTYYVYGCRKCGGFHLTKKPQSAGES